MLRSYIEVCERSDENDTTQAKAATFEPSNCTSLQGEFFFRGRIDNAIWDTAFLKKRHRHGTVDCNSCKGARAIFILKQITIESCSNGCRPAQPPLGNRFVHFAPLLQEDHSSEISITLNFTSITFYFFFCVFQRAISSNAPTTALSFRS